MSFLTGVSAFLVAADAALISLAAGGATAFVFARSLVIAAAALAFERAAAAFGLALAEALAVDAARVELTALVLAVLDAAVCDFFELAAAALLAGTGLAAARALLRADAVAATAFCREVAELEWDAALGALAFAEAAFTGAAFVEAAFTGAALEAALVFEADFTAVRPVTEAAAFLSLGAGRGAVFPFTLRD